MAEDVAPRATTTSSGVRRTATYSTSTWVRGRRRPYGAVDSRKGGGEGRKEKEEEGASSKRPQSRWAGGLRRVDHLVVCPARAGRLLRFAGDTYHSVPRPANAYLDWDAGGTGGRIHTRAPRTPGDHESTAMRRSVILFNTWQDPPEGFGGGDEEEEGGGGAAAAAAAEQGEPRSDDSIDNASPEPQARVGGCCCRRWHRSLCRSAATTTATRSSRKVPLGDRGADPSTTTLRCGPHAPPPSPSQRSRPRRASTSTSCQSPRRCARRNRGV